jgi:hypothetical protein
LFCFGLAVLACSSHVSVSHAVNWEGHDDWLSNNRPVQAFADGLPEPLVVPAPRCEDVAARHAANVYEQVPIAGLNCVETKVGE